ncbi:hypothetical protein Hdeb2414_s0018g00524641 [Helianthus debilis subsp. tardiflorus]
MGCQPGLLCCRLGFVLIKGGLGPLAYSFEHLVLLFIISLLFALFPYPHTYIREFRVCLLRVPYLFLLHH